MIVDLIHNKIVKETATEAFRTSVSENLCPKLAGLFGETFFGIQMYEDYINDDFARDGYWYYPMTVLLGSGIKTVWVRWNISSDEFSGGIPYSYTGASLDFEIVDDVPAEFEAAIEGRSRYFDEGYVKLNISTSAPGATFLSGKYSQTFVDEMTRQLTGAISRACGIKGLDNSSIEIDMVFSPESYMEHTSENVTYRRLLMSAKGCGARDFWIKWTRLNSSVAFSVKDHVRHDEIVFEIGEDVSHKIREKEYRFLVYGNSDKYRVAMGRKNITEWRELIKRALKRGELEKTSTELETAEHATEVSDKLSEILSKCGVSVPSYADEQANSSNVSIANEALLSALGINSTVEEEDEQVEFSLPDGLEISLDDIERADAEDELIEDEDDLLIAADELVEDEEPEAELIEDEEYVAPPREYYIPMSEPAPAPAPQKPDESELLRREIEEARRKLEEERAAMEEARRKLEEERRAVEEARARIAEQSRITNDVRERIEDEMRARRYAEEEAEKLRREHEDLIRENQILEEKSRIAEENRARAESERREHENKLREQIELEAREKTREKLLFAEAARLAREEYERIEAEKAEAEALRAAEEAQREAARIAEAERIAEIERIQRERERIEAETRARIEEDARRRADIEARAREARAQMEAMARSSANSRAEGSAEYAYVAPAVREPVPKAPVAEPVAAPVYQPAEPTPAPVPTPAPKPEVNYTYTSKLVRLMFRRTLDPNITARIHEMISLALEHFGKEDVYIKVKASVPDSSTVILNFVKIPEEELGLLVDIIKFLGNSDMGIYKVILE